MVSPTIVGFTVLLVVLSSSERLMTRFVYGSRLGGGGGFYSKKFFFSFSLFYALSFFTRRHETKLLLL